MVTNPYQVVRDFEEAMAAYVGSPYAVAVDSCTNALFLCCTYLKVERVTIPSKTYISVPGSIIHSGGKVEFEDLDWSGSYQLKPYPIYDSACLLARNMFVENTFQCISFSANKHINIGKGGMIFTDSPDAVKWFKLARYEGREETSVENQKEFNVIGWNMYMTPEQAARGLILLSFIDEFNIINPLYPDISKYKIWKI